MKLPEWQTVQRYPSGFRFPGGESFTEMQTRMVDTVDRLRAKHPGGVVVAVSHADPIKAAVAHAIGTHLDLFQRIVISHLLGDRHRLRRRPARSCSPSTPPAARSPSSGRHEPAGPMSEQHRFDEVDAFTAATGAAPASASSTSRCAAARPWSP